MTKSIPKIPAILLIFLACFLLFGNILDNGYVWDDFDLIQRSDALTKWENVGQFFSVPFWNLVKPDMASVYHRPTVPFLILITSTLFGTGPAGFHLVSVILFALCAWAFFLVAKKMGLQGAPLWIAAGIFIVHPIHVQAVAWVSATTIIVCGLFFLLAFLGSLHLSGAQGFKRKWFLFELIFLTYAASILSYELAFSLPVLVFFYDLIHPTELPQKSFWTKFREYSGYTIITLAIGALHFFATVQTGTETLLAPPDPYLGNVIYTYQNWEWLLRPMNILTRYIELLLFPMILTPDHYFWATDITLPAVASFLIFALATLALLRTEDKKIIVFCGVWMLVTLLPVLNLLPTGGQFGDRCLFLCSMGFCLWLAIALKHLEKLLLSKSQNGKKIFWLITFLIFVGYSAKTYTQNNLWQDEFTFKLNTSILSSHKASTHNELGIYLAQRGHYEEARKEFEIAHKMAPNFLYVNQNLVHVYNDLGLHEKAKEIEDQYPRIIEEERKKVEEGKWTVPKPVRPKY